jgi:TatD DNase family protein
MAKEAMEFGFYISFSGIVTFNNASDLRQVVKKIPLDRLLVETDSPWLAPVPFRGKQNEPKNVFEVAQCVAEIKNISLEELAEITTRNFFTLFNTSQS